MRVYTSRYQRRPGRQTAWNSGCRILAGIVCAILSSVCAIPDRGLAWGSAGHRIINGNAVDLLPTGPLRALFEAHRTYIVDHSVDPDRWKEFSAGEGVRHFMDLDRYGSAPPYAALPRAQAAAVERYGDSAVSKNGIVPWVVGDWWRRCVDDMQRHNSARLLMDAAVLGHYAADSHVPFHAVENYDGQLSDQKGIHARFESMLVERYVRPRELSQLPVRYLDDPVSADFSWLVESASLAPGILRADRRIHARFPDYESSGYRSAFWKAVGSVVRQRLEEGSADLASLWYSAWITAGKPELDASASEIANTAAASGIPHDRVSRPASP